MGSTDEGAICQLDQAEGMNKALVKMAQNIVDKTKTVKIKSLQFLTATAGESSASEECTGRENACKTYRYFGYCGSKQYVR